jgi:cellulose synthase/poly-beta-1,6-N-acetylglucosamine synthase-like glycosyltransferase
MIVLVSIVFLLTAHTAVNALLLRRPSIRSTVDRTIAVLLPLRDEAHRAAPCLEALAAIPDVRLVVLDDGSTDGTADLVRRVAPNATLLTGEPLPDGWLGKPHACQQLADHALRASPDVLVFVDADVVLTPQAVASTVALMEDPRVDLLCPYPKIIASSWGERLVQPLLQWSWLTFLPLRAMERSHRPSLAANGGQFFAVRAAAYTEAGGHAAVRAEVLEDIELARQVKRTGGRIALADGSRLASCRMYTSWHELVEGYSKSLWASFGSPIGASLVTAVLIGLYIAPLLCVAFGRWLGLAAYALAVVGRAVTARATGGRALPDALAHPASIALLAWLVARSFARRRHVRWKGRATWPTSS